MAVDIAQFWTLMAESRLLGSDQIANLQRDFADMPGAGQGNAKALAEWLIERNVFSRYQATILLAGRSGPFIYGDYRIYDRLTDGPFTKYFRAVHAPTGHPVLLNFITGPISESESRWSRFREQVRSWSRITHANLRQIYEAVDLGSFKFVVCEDVRGTPLDEMMAKRGGRLAPADAAGLIYQAASALQQVHASGLAHGHLRPARMLEANGVLRLVQDPKEFDDTPRNDLDEEQSRVRADYMAPELTRAGKAFDVTTDVYALGCCFYHMLAGSPPFDGGDAQGKMQRHAAEAIKPLNTMGVPSQLGEIVTYMMAKNVSVRFANMQVVSQKLHETLSAAPPAPPQPAASLASYRESISQREQEPESIQFDPTPAGGGVGIQVAAAPSTVAARQPRSGRAARSRRSGRPSFFGKYMPVIVGALVLAAGGGLLLIMKAMNNTDKGNNVAGNGGGGDNGGGGSSDNGHGNSNKDGGKNGGRGPNGKTGTVKKGPTDKGEFKRQTVVDDDRLPWASPTDGVPIDLKMMPPGGQMFVVVRPAALLATPHGAKVLSAFGPAVTSSQATWESVSGIQLNQIDELVMGVYDNGEAFPRPAFRVRLATPHTRAALLAKWGNPSPTMHDAGAYFTSKGWSYYLPSESEVTTFAMGYESDIKDVVEFAGAAPPLRRGMGPLLAGSDRDRHLSVIFAPNFLSSNLLRDGRKLFFGEPRKVRLALDWFMADNLDAGLLTLHFDEQFYFELRAHATLENDKQQVADGFKQRIHEIPDRLEEYIAALNPHRHWRLVANRYPGMMRFLDRHVRAGVELDQAVVNCRLPGVAAHNLIFGGEMLLVSAPGGGSVGPVTPVEKPPQTIEELLTRKFDVDIPQNDLNLAVDEMVRGIKEKFSKMPFDFQVKILGSDLMADGITRNQAIVDFKITGEPLSSVFTKLVLKANGDQKDPSAASQKLIWVIGPDPANAETQMMLLTTRKAAKAKNYKLPDVFIAE